MRNSDDDDDDDDDDAVEQSSNPNALSQFDLKGWRPDASFSDDENYMDIVLLITRNSKGEKKLQGHLGALIVRPSTESNLDENVDMKQQNSYETQLYNRILGAATNSPIYSEESTSDLHAEIDALGQACRACQSTVGCTAYITIPPCKNCFAALVTFGIKRIVSRRLPPTKIQETALKFQMELVGTSREINRRQMERINMLWSSVRNKTDDELMEIVEENRKRREERRRLKSEKAATNNIL
jgi:deoxycytidylate deaminase